MDRSRTPSPPRSIIPLPASVLLFIALVCPAVAVDRFPVSVMDDRGVTVRLAAPPRRVVSLAPSLTEIVFLLGRQELLAGVTRYCNFPPAAADLPEVGGGRDPDG